MSEKHLLVDFENIQQINPADVPSEYRITVFTGHKQKAISFETVERAQPLGSRLTWKRVEGGGKNAADFHIAYYLGEFFTKNPEAECIVLSKDTGFDPLIRDLKKNGRICERVESVQSIGKKPTPKRKQKSSSDYSRIVALLRKIEEKARPKSRTTLIKHLSSQFKNIASSDVTTLVDRMLSEGKLTEINDVLSYAL